MKKGADQVTPPRESATAHHEKVLFPIIRAEDILKTSKSAITLEDSKILKLASGKQLEIEDISEKQ